MSRKEMPIFTRPFDFLAWLLPVTNHFPTTQRHSFTRRLLAAAFDLRERLEEANARSGAARLERLARADEGVGRCGKDFGQTYGGGSAPSHPGA